MAVIKNLVNFASKFFEMAKANKKNTKKAAAKAKPVAKAKKAKPTTSKPVAKKAVKPASKPAAKKKAVPVKPVAKKAKPIAKPVAKKADAKGKKAAKPVAKPVSKAVKATPKPVAKKAVKKPAVTAKPVKKASKPVAKVVKPVAKATKPIAKPQPKPAPKVVAKPAAKPAVKAPEVKKTTPTAAPKVTDQKLVAKASPKLAEEPIKLRYSDAELKEFKDLIERKLVIAREELAYLKESLENHNETQAGNKAWNMEEGTDTSEMENLMNQISRQHTFIRNLEMALVRVENKTYGICRQTGKLIPKERLRVVPHATLSLEAKQNRKAEEESPAAGVAAAPPTDFAEGFDD